MLVLKIIESLIYAVGIQLSIAGCDTTSDIDGQGKLKALKLAQTQDDAHLCSSMNIF